MKVVHLVPALFGPTGLVGGAERYALELARHMAESVPTTLVSFGDQSKEERMGALRVRTIGGPWHVRGQSTNPFSFSVFSEIADADVVHCHQQHVLMSSVAAAWCRVTGRRAFVSDLGGGGWDISAYVSTDGWFHGHLHISQYSRSVHGQTGRSNAHVVGGGVDTHKFSPDPSVPRDGGALFVGRLLPHKGVDDLIRGLPEGLPLTIVGPAPHPETKSRLLGLAAGKAVTFMHDLGDDALVQQYRRASCVVLPSVYRAYDGSETKVPELLGQTLLEGMACGAPAICTRVASMPEVVDDRVTGFVVAPNDPSALGDRVAWLHAHPREAHAMGMAGRQRVLNHFTWSGVVSRCLEIYRSTMPRYERSGLEMQREGRG